MDPSAVEIRVLGCLIEKQRTTPDTYPLTLNALRLACNQSTNRDPVVDYSEPTIRTALSGLSRRRWARTASGQSSRAPKFRHLLDQELGLSDAEISILCVLMLRGAQTPGELKQRTERLHGFAGLDEIHAVLEKLIERGLAARLLRRPGQKEERYEQRLGGGEEVEEPEDAGTVPMGSDPVGSDPMSDAETAPDTATETRLDRLEQELSQMRAELSALRQSLGG